MWTEFWTIVSNIASVCSIIALPIAIWQIFDLKTKIEATKEGIKTILEIKEHDKLNETRKLVESQYTEICGLLSLTGKSGKNNQNIVKTCQKIIVSIVEEVSEKCRTGVTLLCDTNHILSSDYSEVIVVGAGADAVDYKLINICHKGDIVVTQDYGVAAMALGKGAYAIHQSGKWYTNENIDQMLME